MNDQHDKTKTIIINDVILTPAGFEFVNQLQLDNNAYLIEARDQINDIISKLINEVDDFDKDYDKELIESAKYLAAFNHNLRDLMKP